MEDIKKPQRHECFKSLRECIWNGDDELGRIIYESLRDFYRDSDCTDIERVLIDIFNDAHSIAAHVGQCFYPSIYFRAYENIGFEYRAYNNGFRYGGHIRKEIVMSVAYQLITRYEHVPRALNEIETLLNDIRNLSIKHVKDFHHKLTTRCDKEVPIVRLQPNQYFGQQYSFFTEKEKEKKEQNIKDEIIFKSPFAIAKGKRTSVLVILEAMYNAKWIHRSDGKEYTCRNDMLKDFMRVLFNEEETKTVKQLLGAAKHRTYDGKKKYFDELMRYIAEDKKYRND